MGIWVIIVVEVPISKGAGKMTKTLTVKKWYDDSKWVTGRKDKKYTSKVTPKQKGGKKK
jgi:hypothetical protein